MTDRRLFLAPMLVIAPLALLAACNDEVSDDGRSASGEVLEGTVSDAMLPVDRVQSEPPLEDPEAFAQAQSEAAEGAPQGDAAAAETEGEAPDAEAAGPSETAAVPPPEPAD